MITSTTEAAELEISPSQLHHLMTGYLSSKAIFAAVELGVFDALDDADATAEALATRLGLDVRPTRILLTALLGDRLLGREDGRYRNSRTARTFLVSSSPSYMGGFARHQNVHFGNFSRLTDALRTNTSITGRVEKQGYANQGASPAEDRAEGTRRFVHALHGSALLQAESLAAKVTLSGARHLVDLGCGSGA
jgi:hypothetical protein